MDGAILERLLSRVLKTCKFFPKVSEILEPLASAEANAAPEAAEEAWARVLEIRRVHWNPDIPGPFDRALARLSDRVRQAARAAGVFREFTAAEFEKGALHTWGKKRFVESFIAYGELERDQFLLPDGELKSLLASAAETKKLPSPGDAYQVARAAGEKNRAGMSAWAAVVSFAADDTLPGPREGESLAGYEERILAERETNPRVIEEIRCQKEALFAKYAQPGSVEVSA